MALRVLFLVLLRILGLLLLPSRSDGAKEERTVEWPTPRDPVRPDHPARTSATSRSGACQFLEVC
jgi:hypothetical protein